MDVIPVIDVRHGTAVRAERGQRTAYRPLQTPLAQGSDPVAVALGLRSLFPFPTVYIADLDGIEGRGANADLPQQLAAALPGVGLWIDAGPTLLRRHAGGGRDPRHAAECRRKLAWMPATVGMTMVVGSESVAGADELETLPPDGYVLSLDFKGDAFLGPPPLLTDSALWPERVIVMTLGRVGSGEGPDLDRVAGIVARAGGRRIYAAGGVRDRDDVEALRDAGAAGVLVASALHAGTLTAGDLEQIAGR